MNPKYRTIPKMAAILLTAMTLSIASGQAMAVPDASASPALHRGTNIAAWLTSPRREIYVSDAKEIKDAGFDFVRLPIEPELFHFTLSGSGPAAKEMNFYTVDKAIAMMNNVGLAVVLDFHPQQEFKDAVEKSAGAEDRFAGFWAAVAEHYKGIPANLLAYELMNEPQYYNKEDQWNALQRHLVSAVRAEDKRHLIILSGAQGDSIEGLLKVDPVADPNVAYDFHFYEPFIVTHQGAWWGFEDKQIRYLKHVTYPSDTVDKSAIAVTAGGNQDAAMLEVDRYIAEDWNKAHIAARIEMAADWAKEHHVRLLNLEFGVLITRTDRASRFRWLSDVRSAFDTYKIGWAVFDYTDSFAIIQPNGVTQENPNGSTSWSYPPPVIRSVDPAVIKALGLPANGKVAE